MTEYFDICGTRIAISAIKDFRTIQVEFIFRPVFRESKKLLMSAISGKKYEFAYMEPYAAIIGQQGHKSELGEYKAKTFKEALGKDISGAVIYTIADKLKLKAFKRQKYQCVNLAGRAFTAYLDDIPAKMLWADGRTAEVYKEDKLYAELNEITTPGVEYIIRTSSIYSTTDVQLINGCYYRVVVVYELSIRTEDSNFLFINTDKHDYKKYAEIYEFYACTDNGETNPVDPNQTYGLGTKVRVKNFDGYFGEELIDKKDVHYGWDIGNFFVSGYTDEAEDTDGDMVFLKNVGDKVTLWFKLNQNIDGLNGKDNLSVTADSEGYDQYFETPKMDFGRGVLIIRYTDHNNVKAEPTIYTNYLEANATVGADTKVQLFEEGDYEVALDYEITSDELIDKVGHYRIFFKFSVRNGNCMVYPFDVKTGSELTNSSMTENGFRLDLAKSRYLKINLKRETLKDSADGLVEDTRFNGPAKDGAEYTDEGIYTITVSNEYTGQFTTKKIYVGTNNILRAYMTTGLSIPEINGLVADGATIADDGTNPRCFSCLHTYLSTSNPMGAPPSAIQWRISPNLNKRKSIFLIEICFISIGPELQPFGPGRSATHLFADRIHAHFR